MFLHTPYSALRSLATQALCTSLWLHPLDSVHGDCAPYFLPDALQALERATHRVLSFDSVDLDGLPGPDLDEVLDLLLESHDLALTEDACAVRPAAESALAIALGRVASCVVVGRPVSGAALQDACRSLLAALQSESAR